MIRKVQTTLFLLLLIPPLTNLKAQTDIDGLMMARKNICGGFSYGHSSWNYYWEGTYRRNNQNLGTVSSSNVMAMVNYGITDKWNIIAMAPWVSTKASAGTLTGVKGIQDLTLVVKNQFLSRQIKSLDITAMGIAGVSTPLTNYVADYLPLSIGLHSKNAFLRLMADVQKGNWYATASGTYMVRSNVTIDRTSYYTTELIYSNQVMMPDVWMYNVRLGWRKDTRMVLEMVFDRMNTLGGFDIRKNDMPFPSNNMESTRLGINFKLPIPKVNGLSLIGNSMYTLAGRNMGQSTAYSIGAVYQADLTGKEIKK